MLRAVPLQSPGSSTKSVSCCAVLVCHSTSTQGTVFVSGPPLLRPLQEWSRPLVAGRVLRSCNTSGCRGSSWQPSRSCWPVQLTHMCRVHFNSSCCHPPTCTYNQFVLSHTLAGPGLPILPHLRYDLWGASVALSNLLLG